MASFLTRLGRLAFFVLITTQSIFLSAYLAKYEGKSNWYFMAFSFGPPVFAWIHRLRLKSLRLRWLFRIWGLYILAFDANIAMVLVIIGDRVSKTEFLSPNVLRAILCITPLLLLLLLNTGDLDDSVEGKKGREIVSKLCFPMAVDLFDGVEMIDIVLEAREHNFGIPKAFSVAMIASASVSFIMLVIPWQMVETKLTEQGSKTRFRTAMLHNIVQMVFVNVPFLVIRSVVFMFGKDESIFIAKNCIGIVLSLMEIRDLRHSRRVGHGDCGDQRDQRDQRDQGDQGDQRDQGDQGDQVV